MDPQNWQERSLAHSLSLQQPNFEPEVLEHTGHERLIDGGVLFQLSSLKRRRRNAGRFRMRWSQHLEAALQISTWMSTCAESAESADTQKIEHGKDKKTMTMVMVML